LPKNLKERVFVACGFAFVLGGILFEFSLFDEFFSPFSQLIAQEQYVCLLLSCVLWCLSVGGVFVVVFAERSIIRSLSLPVLLAAFLFNLGSYQISHAPLEFQQADSIVRHFHSFFWGTVENFGWEVLPLVLLFVPLTIGIDLLPDKFPFRFPKRSIYVPLITVLLVCISFLKNIEPFDRFPAIYRVPALFIFAAIGESYDQGRDGVDYNQEIMLNLDQLIVIVDESIRGDMLGINDNRLRTTPVLSSLKSNMVNYGMSASSSNCSDFSNLILRSGLKASEIPDIEQYSLKYPSVWQYARRAGYQTYYIDAQHGKEGTLQNFMNEEETKAIDRIFYVKQKQPYLSDTAVIERLADLLERDEKIFVLINKYGVHFPYLRSYPENQTFFRPALKKGEPLNERRKVLNTYKNGIRWAVDTWFRTFFTKNLSLRNYLIIYTSDHGQNILDNGSLCTHCCPGSQASRFEGIVPMVLFSDRDDFLKPFQDMKQRVYNLNIA